MGKLIVWQIRICELPELNISARIIEGMRKSDIVFHIMNESV